MENRKNPMDLLREFAPEFAQQQMDGKALLFENAKYQAVPKSINFLLELQRQQF